MQDESLSEQNDREPYVGMACRQCILDSNLWSLKPNADCQPRKPDYAISLPRPFLIVSVVFKPAKMGISIEPASINGP